MAVLRDRVIIVTGGAQGIGRAYCTALAAEGARVVVADVDGARTEETAAALQRDGAGVLAVPTDVTEPADTERMAADTLARFGRIDGLVNNAAMFQRPAVSRALVEEISVEEWDRVLAVNLRGLFLCARAVVPQMKQQRYGKIVNISSTTVYHGTPRLAHYVTSKAGVIGFTPVPAQELGDYNVTVNAVAPGITLSVDEPSDELVQAQQRRAQVRAIKRVQTPDDLVGMIVFLCSAASDFITGQTIAVDGGAAMH